MTDLVSLEVQIRDQFFDPWMNAIPSGTIAEAVKQALAVINARFSEAYSVSGVGGSVVSTLPVEFEAPLLLGASAFILEFAIRNYLVTQVQDFKDPHPLSDHAQVLRGQFGEALEEIRRGQMERAVDVPYFQVVEK